MPSIRKLSPYLIAQIAAGEVIERPSYAIKELIDNSIDALATDIKISLENYGLKKISIIDNGNGMGKEDLLESYKIHTTSKIENEDSLTAIKSLGFRGEALASIASVAKLTIKTKTEGAIAGSYIEIEDGELKSEGPIGIAKGTQIDIENIFANVPARKKFLKSPQTELRQIIEVFISFAIAFPTISFTLQHNSKILFKLTKTDQLTRISSVLDKTFSQSLIPVINNDSHILVNGFIAHPQFTTQSQNKQYLFINNRRIHDRQLFQVVKDSYGTLLPQRQHPVFILFLTIPYELIDVNVHPRKEQLGFFNNDHINLALTETVTSALKQLDNLFEKKSYQPITANFSGKTLKSLVDPWQTGHKQLSINYKTITQIHNLYICIEEKHGLLLIDQHAAHERILFEQYKQQFLNQKNILYHFPKPITLKFTLQEKLIIDEFKDKFLGLGISFNQNYSVTTVPLLLKDRNLGKLLKELFEQLEIKNKLDEFDEISLKVIKFLACKNAIKAGDKLSNSEAIKLIKKLEQTENNLTCPHGRPTKYLFSSKELNYLFKR